MRILKHKIKVIRVLLSFLSVPIICLAIAGQVFAATAPPPVPQGCPGGPVGSIKPGTTCPGSNLDPSKFNNGEVANPKGSQCGGGDQATTISIDIGCSKKGNAILDATFAIMRDLSYGVGVVIILSTVYAGIQYTLAGDDPRAVTAAKDRIRSNLIALLIFIFAAAIIDYVVPAGFLQ